MTETVLFKHLDNPKMLLGMQAIDGLVLISAAVCWVFVHHFFVLGLSAAIFIFLRRKIKQSLPKFYLTGLCYFALPKWTFNELWRVCLPHSRKTLYLR